MEVDHLNDLMKAMGVVLLKRRKVLGLSQTELANSAGIHRTYISDVENGKRNFSLGTLHNLSCSLKITMLELIEQSMCEAELSKAKSGEVCNSNVSLEAMES